MKAQETKNRKELLLETKEGVPAREMGRLEDSC